MVTGDGRCSLEARSQAAGSHHKGLIDSNSLDFFVILKHMFDTIDT